MVGTFPYHAERKRINRTVEIVRVLVPTAQRWGRSDAPCAWQRTGNVDVGHLSEAEIEEIIAECAGLQRGGELEVEGHESLATNGQVVAFDARDRFRVLTIVGKGVVALGEFLDQFSDQNCPFLTNIPKMVIVRCCRY